MRGLAALVSVAFLWSAPVLAEGKSIIVLDGSGSMWGQIDGRPKLEIAREALAGVLAGLPAETELGLIAYGHREKGNCADIEMMVGPRANTAAAITSAANGMQFLGKTPLTEAVRQAAAELRSTEEKATVILITDGIETCEADPCALGRELEASGIDFTAHVVGFGLTAEEGKQVACLAENTGGLYIEAKDAGSLAEALQSTVAAVEPAATTEPVPAPAPAAEKPAALAHNFAPIARLVAGGPDLDPELRPSMDVYTAVNGARGDRVMGKYDLDPILLEPGRYIIVIGKDLAEVEAEVEITADTLSQPELILNAGFLTITPLDGANAVIERAPVDFTGPASSGHYGVSTRLVPAGDYSIAVRDGQAMASAAVQVKAGETTALDVIVASGLAVIDTYYTPDMIMEDIGQGVDIYKAAKAVDGSRERITGSYGAAVELTLPPGDYIAIASKEEAAAERPFTVTANARVEVQVVLNAGVLAFTAPGAKGVQIFSAKKDIQGNRKPIRYDYGEAGQTTLTAGDYILEAEVDGTMMEAAASVIAGERTEITIP